jgi:hypothetical protein
VVEALEAVGAVGSVEWGRWVAKEVEAEVEEDVAEQEEVEEEVRRACSTRRPEPMMGAWLKQKIFHPSLAGCSAMVFSNLG